MRIKLSEFLKYFEQVLESEDPELLKVPYLIIGGVGIGKSRGVRYVAERAGYEVILIPLSRMKPSDLEGLLIPPEEGAIAEKLLPPLFDLVHNKEKVVLFFDELNAANPTMLNAALSMISERELAGVPLPDKTVIVAAVNPVGSGIAYVRELKPVIVNRFTVFYVEADFNYLVEQGLHTKLFTPEVLAYISMFPEAFDDPTPYSIGDDTAQVFAVPRRWEALSKDLSSGVIQLKEEDLEFIEAAVGPVHAGKLLDFAQVEEIIDLVMKKDEKVKDYPATTRTGAIIRLLQQATHLKKTDIQEIEKHVDIILWLLDTLPDEYRISVMKYIAIEKTFFGLLARLFASKVYDKIKRFIDDFKRIAAEDIDLFDVTPQQSRGG